LGFGWWSPAFVRFSRRSSSRFNFSPYSVNSLALCLTACWQVGFSTDDGGHYKEHDLKRWMQRLVREGKLTWLGTHVLRKTCGTRIADGGGGVAAVASPPPPQEPADREPVHRPAWRECPRDRRSGELMEARSARA
jgi:hypothetical protein